MAWARIIRANPVLLPWITSFLNFQHWNNFYSGYLKAPCVDVTLISH